MRDVQVLAPVTALKFVPWAATALIGAGGLAVICDIKTNLQTSIRVFDDCAIHGFRFNLGITDDAFNTVVIAFGGKSFIVFTDEMLNSAVVRCCGRADVIMDVATVSFHAPSLVVVYAHNQVEIIRLSSGDTVLTIPSPVQCLLYAASLHVDTRRSMDKLPVLRVAAGTIFNDVLVWNPLESVAASGLTGAAAEADGECSLARVQRLSGHGGVIFRVRWNPEGILLASASDDRTVRLWKKDAVATWSCVWSSFGHRARLWDVCFSRASEVVLTTSEDATCRAWSAATGRCLGALTGHVGKHTWRVDTSPDGRYVATGGNDGSVKVWSLASHVTLAGQPDPTEVHVLPELDSLEHGTVRCVVVSLDGGFAFVGCSNGSVWRWEAGQAGSLASRAWVLLAFPDTSARPRDRVISAMALDDLSGRLLIGKVDGTVSLITDALRDHAAPAMPLSACLSWRVCEENVRVNKVVFGNDCSNQVVATGVMGHLSSWDISDARVAVCTGVYALSASASKRARAVVSILTQQSRNLLVAGDNAGSVYIWYLCLKPPPELTYPAAHSLRCHGHLAVTCLQFRADSLYTGGHDGRIVRHWLGMSGVETEMKIRRDFVYRPGPIAGVERLWWSEEGRMIVAGFRDEDHIVHDVDGNYTAVHVACGGWKRPWGCALEARSHPASNYMFVFAGGLREGIRVRKVCSEIPQPLLLRGMHGQNINTVRWGPARPDQLLATASEDTSVKVFVSEAGSPLKLIETMTDHTSSVQSLAWSAHADRQAVLLTCGAMQELRIWRVMTGTTVEPVRLLAEYVPAWPASEVETDVEHRFISSIGFPVNTLWGCGFAHVFVTGDSEGMCTVFGIADEEDACALTVLAIFSCGKRPVISLASASCDLRGLVAVGLTDGSAALWDVSDAVQRYVETGESSRERPSAPCRLCSFVVHSMGVNCMALCASLASHVKPSPDVTDFVWVSGGDDQALHVAKIRVTDRLGVREALLVSSEHIEAASASTIKGIDTDGLHVFLSGFDQRLDVWRLHHASLASEARPATLVRSVVLDVPVVESLHVCSHLTADSVYRVAVAAAGLQTLTIDMRS